MRKLKGFTLIELVIVIAILAILAAVAVPRFVNLRDKARRATAEAELGALRAAANLYYASSALSGGGPNWPPTVAILTSGLEQQLTQLTAATPISATPFGWAYAPASGAVTTVGGTGSGWGW